MQNKTITARLSFFNPFNTSTEQIQSIIVSSYLTLNLLNLIISFFLLKSRLSLNVHVYTFEFKHLRYSRMLLCEVVNGSQTSKLHLKWEFL